MSKDNEGKHDHICDNCYLLTKSIHTCVVCHQEKLCSRTALVCKTIKTGSGERDICGTRHPDTPPKKKRGSEAHSRNSVDKGHRSRSPHPRD